MNSSQEYSPKYSIGDKIWLTTKLWVRHGITDEINKNNCLYCGPVLINSIPHKGDIYLEYGLIFPIDIIIDDDVFRCGIRLYFDIKYLDKHSELID